ncbi:MAG: hypothetical protein DWQ08_14780, partial [Proteobacteria bacterium]
MPTEHPVLPAPILEFILPRDLSRAAVHRELGQRFNVKRETLDRGIVYFDTFDWLLHRSGWSLECVDAPKPRARLFRLSDSLMEEQPLDGPPEPFPRDWPRGRVKAVIERITEVRALLPVVSMGGRSEGFAVLNRDGKTVCRLLVESWRVSAARSAANVDL